MATLDFIRSLECLPNNLNDFNLNATIPFNVEEMRIIKRRSEYENLFWVARSAGQVLFLVAEPNAAV